MLLLSLFLLTLNIAFIGKLRPFNSDDLYWQQVVQTWRPFSHHTLYLATKDTFVEEAPFFWLMGHLFGSSRRLLMAESGILTLSSFVLFYVSTLYFLRKLKVQLTYPVLLPFAWLASFGYPLVQNYLNSDWRTFEVGLSFLTFLLTAAICNGDFKPRSSVWSKVLSVLSILLIGVVIYSDPYYLIFTIGPIVLFTGLLYLLKRIDRKLVMTVYGGVVLSFLFGKIVGVILQKAGVLVVTDTLSSFVNFDNIVVNIVESLHGMLIVFGADFFGHPTYQFTTFGYLVNAIVLGYILYKAYGILRTPRSDLKKLSLPQLWMGFFGALVAFVFIIYTSSSLVSVGNYRYFILLVYGAVAFLSLVLAVSRSLNLKLIISTLLVAATLFNIGYTLFGNTIKTQPDVTGNIDNGLNLEIIRTVEGLGLTKGYASYWQGNVNTYLSGEKVTFLPIICWPAAQTNPFDWLVDGGQYNQPTKQTFYLMDPDWKAPPTCTLQALTKQFGKPEKTISISDKLLLVYNYDIVTKMPKRNTPAWY